MWCWSSGGEEQGTQSMQTPCWHSWVSCGLVSGCFFFVVFSSFTVLFEDRCFILLHGFSIKLLCGTSASAQVLHLHICREAWTERCKHMYFYASVLLPGPAPWLIRFSWASLPTVKPSPSMVVGGKVLWCLPSFGPILKDPAGAL